MKRRGMWQYEGFGRRQGLLLCDRVGMEDGAMCKGWGELGFGCGCTWLGDLGNGRLGARDSAVKPRRLTHRKRRRVGGVSRNGGGDRSRVERTDSVVQCCTVTCESGATYFYRRSRGEGGGSSVASTQEAGRRKKEKVPVKSSKKQRRPLLMLHPNFLHSEIFSPQLEGLSKHLDVIGVDLRGHGRSTLPTEGKPYWHADDLDEFMEGLELPTVDVLGLEMGGAVALDFADAYPERVDSLILVNTSAFLHAFNQKSFFNITEALERGGLDGCRADWLARPEMAFTRRNEPVLWYIEQLMAEYDGWHFLHDDRMAFRGGGIDTYHDRIPTKTLLLTAEHCGEECRHIARRLSQQLPNVSSEVFLDTGMFPNLERVNAFNDRILDFLR